TGNNLFLSPDVVVEISRADLQFIGNIHGSDIGFTPFVKQCQTDPENHLFTLHRPSASWCHKKIIYQFSMNILIFFTSMSVNIILFPSTQRLSTMSDTKKGAEKTEEMTRKIWLAG